MKYGLTLVLLFLAGCGADQSELSSTAEDDSANAPIERTRQEGPVKMTISLTPPKPLLGDPLSLLLTVEAQAGVDVEMPAFGEALGRFSILDFVPRQETTADGTLRASHRYTLQAPMSGKQRIPPLRIEYLDARDGATEEEQSYRELLSEELVVEIASVLPEGEVVSELLPPRPELEEIRGGFLARFWPWLLLGLAALGGGYWALAAWQRRVQERIRVTAFDRAMKRLTKLEQQGLPSAQGADAWYVELSDIVRRYIEDQFGVRAPELTTEEFLQEARRSVDLSGRSQNLLSAFLERCDRVKFAGYNPQESESREALDLARQFLETRSSVSEPPAVEAV